MRGWTCKSKRSFCIDRRLLQGEEVGRLVWGILTLPFENVQLVFVFSSTGVSSESFAYDVVISNLQSASGTP